MGMLACSRQELRIVSETTGPTPYQRIGEEEVVRRIASRFYDLMESDPAVAPQRALLRAALERMTAAMVNRP